MSWAASGLLCQLHEYVVVLSEAVGEVNRILPEPRPGQAVDSTCVDLISRCRDGSRWNRPGWTGKLFLAGRNGDFGWDIRFSLFWNRTPVLGPNYLELYSICPHNGSAVIKGW